MPLTFYGIREWGIATVLAIPLVSLFLAGDWLPFPGWMIAGPAALGWFVIAAFFRDPIRRIPTGLDPGSMLSPADGVISAIEHVESHEATDGEPAIVLRIFLSVLNVHINRAPCDATVIGTIYRKGMFLNAQTPESAKVNESNVILLKSPAGESFGMRQVSGLIARCIVCPLSKGDRLIQGHKWGMIKFGSTTELILPRPEEVQVRVSVGDKVKGGKTIIATLPGFGTG